MFNVYDPYDVKVTYLQGISGGGYCNTVKVVQEMDMLLVGIDGVVVYLDINGGNVRKIAESTYEGKAVSPYDF